MKKSKIIFSVVALLLFIFGAQFANASCNGNHYNITNETNVAVEFSYNCSAGDRITTYNVDTGETTTHTLMVVDGENSSCLN